MVVGIAGKARSGKDYLYRTFFAPRGFVRLAFGDALKGLARVLIYKEHAERLGETRHMLAAYIANHYGVWGEEKSPPVRKLLQQLGEEVRQQVDPGVWVLPVLDEANRILAQGRRVAVVDVRHPLEAYALRGQTEAIEAFYAGWEAMGKPFLPWVKEAILRQAVQGKVVLLEGGGLEGELGEHVSEQVEGLPYDVRLAPRTKGTLADLEIEVIEARKRGAWVGTGGWGVLEELLGI